MRGVVIFELLPDKLNQIMAEREGLGETGETILIGPDKRMRASAWLALNSAWRTASAPTSGRCRPRWWSRRSPASRGSGCFAPITMTRVLAAYTQVKVFDTEWAFIAEISTSEAYRPHPSAGDPGDPAGGRLIAAADPLLPLALSITAAAPLSPPPPNRWPTVRWITASPSNAPTTTSTGSPRHFRHMQRSVKDKIELIERQTQELQQQVKADHQAGPRLQQADKLRMNCWPTPPTSCAPHSRHQGMAESHAREPAGLDRRAAKQLGLIIKAPTALARLVDDLLDYQMRYWPS